MKFLAITICLPLVFAANDGLFDVAALKQESEVLVDLLGEEFTQQNCAEVCEKIGKYMYHSCPALCNSMAFLKSEFAIVPKPAGAATKRLILEDFDFVALKKDLQMLVDVAGSDPTEQMCENFFHNYLQAGGLLNFAVPVVCKSVQMLIKLLNIVPLPTSQSVPQDTGKRSLFPDFNLPDLFDLDSLKADVQMLFNVLGSDPTEQACEAEAHKLIQAGSLFDVGVPLVCKSFQMLIGLFHITTPTPQP